MDFVFFVRLFFALLKPMLLAMVFVRISNYFVCRLLSRLRVMHKGVALTLGLGVVPLAISWMPYLILNLMLSRMYEGEFLIPLWTTFVFALMIRICPHARRMDRCRGGIWNQPKETFSARGRS